MKLFSIYKVLIAQCKFGVFVNQEHMHDLSPGESITLEVEPGSNALVIKTPFATASRQINLEMGERIAFSCCPKLAGIILMQKD